MGRELLTVKEPVLMMVKAPQRESGHAAPGPVVGAALPATYRVEPFSKPTVAPPGTETGVLTVPGTAGVLNTPLKSTETTPAAVPPHSTPQFNTNACVSPLPKTAVMG